MSEYIKKTPIIGLAHKLRFGRILTEREVEVVEMVANDVPAADVVEVRHGWWISVEADVWFRCSLCDCEVSTSWDYEQDGMFDYCPCCGAKMDGGESDGHD